MKNKFSLKQILPAFLIFLFLSLPLLAQEKRKITAQDLIQMNMDSSFASIEGLSKEESQELITQIRALYRDSDPNIDKFYFLISHLEEINAIEKEQARLESLNTVYGLGFFLFMGLLIFIWWNQRKIQIQLNRISK